MFYKENSTRQQNSLVEGGGSSVCLVGVDGGWGVLCGGVYVLWWVGGEGGGGGGGGGNTGEGKGGAKRSKGQQRSISLLVGHDVVEGLAGLQAFLHFHQSLDSVHHHLHQLHLREAQAVSVGDVEDSAHSCGVHAT